MTNALSVCGQEEPAAVIRGDGLAGDGEATAEGHCECAGSGEGGRQAGLRTHNKNDFSNGEVKGAEFYGRVSSRGRRSAFGVLAPRAWLTCHCNLSGSPLAQLGRRESNCHQTSVQAVRGEGQRVAQAAAQSPYRLKKALTRHFFLLAHTTFPARAPSVTLCSISERRAFSFVVPLRL